MINNIYKYFTFILSLILFITQAGCSTIYSDDRPEVQYKKAYSADKLEIPPNLSKPDRTGSFIISGLKSGKIQRNSLLPVLEHVKFMRDGRLAWLEVSMSSEALWPLLIEFITHEGLQIKREMPLQGYLETSWQEEKIGLPQTGFDAFFGSALNWIRPTSELSSYIFRIERIAPEATRIFITLRRVEETRIRGDGKDDASDFGWQASSINPEEEAYLLTKLLVFLGVDFQRARDILEEVTYIIESDQQEKVLFISRPLSSVWSEMNDALENIGFAVEESDTDAKFYKVLHLGPFLSTDQKVEKSTLGDLLSNSQDQRTYFVYLSDVSGGVHVSVYDDNVNALSKQETLSILSALRRQFE